MKKLICSLVLCLAVASFSPAAAEDGKISGEISATGKLRDVSGNEAKFNEYRDIQDGVYGGVKLKYDSEKYYFDVDANDMGYDTQRYSLEGGKWGDVKLNLNYDEIPHNLTEDARTFYSGVGTSHLTYSPPTDPDLVSTWKKSFDYSTKRKNWGGGIKLDALKPFFFDVSTSREEKTGTYPIGTFADDPGGVAIELPMPVSYRTDSLKLAAGYSRNPLFLSLNYFYSEFSNDLQSLNFRIPGSNEDDSFSLPPDNHFYKLNLTGGLRLPLNSKLDINLSTASAKSEYSLSLLEGGSGTFHGKLDTQNYAASLTSKPFSFIDTRFFFKYFETKNKSDKEEEEELFDYRKVKFGAEVGFRLPAKFYLNTYYNRTKIDRQREDIPENEDDLYGVELRWSGLDFMTAKIGYERFNRQAEFNDEIGRDDIEYFIRRFDAAEQHRDIYKATFDFFPMDNLNFSLSYRHRETDYPDTVLGLTDDRRDEFSINADYLIMKRIRLFAYFDYEQIRMEQTQRQTEETVNPNLPPTDTDFNWRAKQKDESYNFSLGTDIFIIPEKLTLRLQHSYVESNGSVDYTYLFGANPLPAGRTQSNIDLGNWDDYKLRYYLVQLTYNVTKAWSVTAGYAYEKFTYDDAQYEGYTYVPATDGSNGAYLTGAYQDSSYESHTGFLTMTYRF